MKEFNTWKVEKIGKLTKVYFKNIKNSFRYSLHFMEIITKKYKCISNSPNQKPTISNSTYSLPFSPQ
jgi:hypothetical protein